jgi:hypothetical protein
MIGLVISVLALSVGTKATAGERSGVMPAQPTGITRAQTRPVGAVTPAQPKVGTPSQPRGIIPAQTGRVPPSPSHRQATASDFKGIVTHPRLSERYMTAYIRAPGGSRAVNFHKRVGETNSAFVARVRSELKPMLQRFSNDKYVAHVESVHFGGQDRPMR